MSPAYKWIQIYSIFLDITPFFGFGEYTWSGAVGTCLPIWVGNRGYVIFFSLFATIPFTIIIITTTWTYVFTRNFLRKDFKRRQTMSNNERDQMKCEKSVYNVRIRNLVGIFGMLLLFNVITFSPYIIASMIGLIVGLEKIPSKVYVTALILFLLNNVTNSIIQSYFRRDLRETITKHSKMLAHLIFKNIRCHNRYCMNHKADNGGSHFSGSTLPDGKNGTSDSIHTTQLHDSKGHFSEVSLESQTMVCIESTITKNRSPSLNSVQWMDSDLSSVIHVQTVLSQPHDEVSMAGPGTRLAWKPCKQKFRNSFIVNLLAWMIL